jgi:hypothetical protein
MGSDKDAGPRWRGNALIAVAGLHSLFVLALATGAVSDPQMNAETGGVAPLLLMKPGFGSARPYNLVALTLFWSLFFGLLLATFGAVVRELERAEQDVPRVAGGFLLVICGVGAVLVPFSGFWFALAPAWSLSRRRS